MDPNATTFTPGAGPSGQKRDSNPTPAPDRNGPGATDAPAVVRPGGGKNKHRPRQRKRGNHLDENRRPADNNGRGPMHGQTKLDTLQNEIRSVQVDMSYELNENADRTADEFESLTDSVTKLQKRLVDRSKNAGATTRRTWRR